MGEQCGVCACVVVRICQIESVALRDREVPVEMRPSGLSVKCMETVSAGGDTKMKKQTNNNKVKESLHTLRLSDND